MSPTCFTQTRRAYAATLASAFQLLLLLVIISCMGCGEARKSYMRHPLVHESDIVAGPISEPPIATQAEPYPPPRPNLEIEASNLITVPMIQSTDRTPVGPK
jgi:hypothetical protein